MSSKVKATIDEAREFAASGTFSKVSSPQKREGGGGGAAVNDDGHEISNIQNVSAAGEALPAAAAGDEEGEDAKLPPPLPSEGKVAGRGLTLIADSERGGEPVAYSCEQQRMNIGLREAVTNLEQESVKGSLRLKEIFELAHQNFLDGVLPRHKAVTDFKSMFQWPPVPIEEPQTIFSAETDLPVPYYPIDKVTTQSAKRKECPRAIAVGAASLEEAAHPVESRARMLELKDGIRVPNVLLLDETPTGGEITDEVVIKLREMAHTDVFAFLRKELAKRQHDVDHLRDRLEAVSEEKANAAMIDDVATIERCSFEEINITERMLAKMRDQLDEVFNADADIEAFVEGFENTRDANELMLRRLEAENADNIDKLTRDIEYLLRKKEERLRREQSDVEVHKTFTIDSNAAIQALHRQQTENWARILELVETNVRLAAERETLVQKHLEEHQADCRRRALVDAWIEGCEAYEATCAQARDVLTSTTRWLDDLRRFNNRMIDEVEKKTVHEEAFVTRVQEQLEYLDIYRMYRTFSDELIHRKEVKAGALQRLSRNLELQIKEAQVTLDPHKKRYVEERDSAERDHDETKATLASLQQRATKEKKYWQPIEDQLEQAQVEFDPPDIRADKTRVELRAQVVSRARAFLASEQEHVDKDALNLRKLATTNALLIKSHEKKKISMRNMADAEQKAIQGGHEL